MKPDFGGLAGNRKDLNTEYRHVAMKVTNICILCNVLLCLIKMAGGLIAGSSALISDGINSAFDVVSGAYKSGEIPGCKTKHIMIHVNPDNSEGKS